MGCLCSWSPSRVRLLETPSRNSHDLPADNLWEAKTRVECAKSLKNLVSPAGFEPTTP
jgi:hypothetical protein